MLRLQYILRFRRSMETFREMMIDRGCKDSLLCNETCYKEWVESIVEDTKVNETGFYHHNFEKYKHTKQNVRCIVSMVRKPKLAQLRQEMKKVKDDKETMLIVISLFPMSSSNERFLSTATHGGEIRIQLLYCSQLQINITKNVFVPKHTLVTSEEKTRLFTKMKLDESQISEFPILSRKDPIVLYYDFPAGALIRIERELPFIGNTLYYRWIR